MNRGPGSRVIAQQNQLEGAKDTRQSLIKLTKSLKPYLPAIILALLLALIGTIFQVLGPDRLKLLTDEIMRVVLCQEIGQTKLKYFTYPAIFCMRLTINIESSRVSSLCCR